MDIRKHYLDNLRWLAVLLVLVYHVFYLFNGVGVLGGIPNAQSIPFFDGVATMIYPWFMVLLFVISGMSARYALKNKTGKKFLKERALKLIIPSVLGPFVIHWVTGYLNIKLGGGLEYIPKALVYPVSVISGTGPLWFIQMLFLFSCLILPLKKLEIRAFEKMPTVVFYMLFIFVFGGAQILNLPVFTTYRFGIYFVAFLSGYFILYYDEVQKKLENARWWSLALATVFGVWYGVMFHGANYTQDFCLKNIVTNIYLWFVVLAVLGFGKKCFDKPFPYMSKSSYGLYILHYPVLMVVCYVLTSRFSMSPILNYITALVLEVAITFGVYEVIKRIPIIRFWVLGIKRQNNS